MATLLVITPLSGQSALTLPPYAARGLTQTLEPVVGSGSGNALGTLVREDVNGELVDLTHPQFRKYQSEITCKDQYAPLMDGAWIGQIVEVECAAELGYITGGTPQRPAVSGSSRTEGHFTFYQPLLVMMVTAISHGFDEYPHDYAWKLSLRELMVPTL